VTMAMALGMAMAMRSPHPAEVLLPRCCGWLLLMLLLSSCKR